MGHTKAILVTGSSRGIGAGFVTGFARKGYRVIINYSQSEKEANQLYQEICRFADSKDVMVVKADVTSRSEVGNMFDRVTAHFGSIDVLINNAGVNMDGPFLEMSDEQWRRVIDTILTGTFICSQEFALRYKGDTGCIITIGATTGIRGRKNGCNYCSARAGVITITKCLALELAPKIRVNCITPGLIETEEVMTRFDLYQPEKCAAMLTIIPAGRLGQPEDVYKLAEFLVENADYVTGQNFLVTGGNLMY